MAENSRTGPTRRELLAFGGGAAANALFLGACSRGGDGAGTSGGGSRRGGTLTFSGLFGVDTTLDLHKTWDPATLAYVSPVYSKLVDFKTGPNVTGLDVVPDLAGDWTMSADGLTYTFQLRDNVVWHDIPPVSGRKFTAGDVLATFDRIRRMPAYQAWQFQPVKDVRAPDDYTVVFTLNHPYAPLLSYLARPENAIFPREGMAGEYDIAKQAIGTGPFMVESWERDEQWIRVRHPKYYMKGKPYLDQLNTVIIPQTQAVEAALRSGRIDVGGATDVDSAERMTKRPNLQGKSVLAGAALGLYMQRAKGPYTDLRVRRAVAMAINYEGLGRTVWGEYKLSSTIPPACGDFALPEEEIKKVRPYDPERSRQLLAQAGYPNGFRTELLVQQVSPKDVQSAEFIAQDLERVGIAANLQVTDPGTAIQRRRNGQFQLHIAQQAGILANTYLSYYKSDSIENYTRINDPKLERMIDRSQRITDHRERVNYIRDIQRYMEREVSSVIFTTNTYAFPVWNSRVHNYHPNQAPSGREYANVWVEE